MPSISRTGTSFRFHRLDAPAVDAPGADAMVFIHGVGLNHRVWKPQFEHFSKTHSVLAYDFLGHGLSPLPPAEVSLGDYTGQLLGLLDDLNIEQAHLVGHSMGALIATGFALAHPARTRSLTALNMVYQRDDRQREQVLTRAKQVLDSGKIEGIDLALRRWFPGQDVSPGQEPRIDQVREWLGANDPVGYGCGYELFARSDQLFSGQLEQLQSPALFLTGSDDPNSTPAMSQALAEACPRGDFMVVEGEAHMMAYRSPERINPLIDGFVSDQSAPATIGEKP